MTALRFQTWKQTLAEKMVSYARSAGKKKKTKAEEEEEEEEKKETNKAKTILKFHLSKNRNWQKNESKSLPAQLSSYWYTSTGSVGSMSQWRPLMAKGAPRTTPHHSDYRTLTVNSPKATDLNVSHRKALSPGFDSSGIVCWRHLILSKTTRFYIYVIVG